MELSEKYNELISENQELRYQLEEATETIDAIRTGQVDALIVQNGDGPQLYTLKTADQTYRMFIEKMNEGAVTLNREGIILYSNSRFANMIKAPLEKVIGLTFDVFIHNTSVGDFSELFNNGWEGDCKQEICLVNKKAEEMPCLVSCSILDLDEGPAMSLILTDLSLQKATEKQLKHKNEELGVAQDATKKLNDELEDTVKERTRDLTISREHFKLLSDNITQMTWTNQPNGEVDFFNKRWYDYTGSSFYEIKEWGWQNVVHPDDLQETTNRYVAALNSGKTFEMENRYKRHDGEYRWHLNRANPLRNEAGDIILWVGTATDIEDQKREMDKKDEFIGIASHELKTPLTSLKGYLQLVASYKREEIPPVVKQYVAKANSSLNKLQRLVNDLLDVSKIQAGRLEYAMNQLDIAGLLKACIENAEHIYPDFNFHNQANSSFIINGNSERLEQVVMNLVNNAVKYSPGNNDITIATEQRGNMVRISVIDDGIGLSAEQQEKIFERFYRVEDKKFTASGLGMGLYISNEIVSAHNGDIGVESQLGKGSTFYFDLPLL